VELLLALALVGTLSVLVAPALVSYAKASAMEAGARELATVINLGRQVAISQNTAVCVEIVGTSVRLRQGGCAGTAWTGPGTDGAGVIKLSDPGTLVVSSTANVVFSNLGAASPAGTYTVARAGDDRTRTVVVAATGRVSVR
jgi:Tfp pilus assembly protein FimT